MITAVTGVRVGHWTDSKAQTGCTVVRFPEGTVASGEVRGGAPATRDFVLLSPDKTVARIDAVCLSGRSVFGLAAADGVVRVLEEAGIGLETPAGIVPIVVGLSLFDLSQGDASVRPGPEAGAAACRAASDGDVELGLVGAGAGATVGKWSGLEGAIPGGLGGAVRAHGDVVIGALIAVNAVGWIDDGSIEPRPRQVDVTSPNTTLGVVVPNAALDKTGCFVVAQGGHGGFARAITPAHTRSDGDAIVAAATGEVEADVDLVRWLATEAVEEAVRSAVR